MKALSKKPKIGVSSTDCSSDEGIVVGLIDGMIANARIIRRMKGVKSHAIREALKDLRQDKDMSWLLQKTNVSKWEHEYMRKAGKKRIKELENKLDLFVRINQKLTESSK